MERARPASSHKYMSKTTVDNFSSDTAGSTYAAPAESSAASAAELEVLKAIINREGYLNRLHSTVRTVSKKFKPEIPDILDFVRAASLDVVEMIVKWREIKVIYMFHQL